MESDENNKEYLSEEGFSRLKEELTSLKEKRRKEIAERLEYAKSLGDLAENAEYQEAKEEQELVESRILDIEDTLGRAVLISHPTVSFISVGSTVITRKEGNSKEECYFIVGREEADPSQNRISNESPLGRALLGKKRGEAVKVLTPRGEIHYEILEIK